MLLIDALTAAAGDSYIVERELGRGGMGAVFLARDRALERPVAIKVLPPDLASQSDLRERFMRETRTAAAFSHPHIVPVHAVEERGGLLLFVMGFVDGETLASRVRRLGPMNAADATRLLREAAWALSYAHGRGTVHRDIKPDNILIERATGRALVLDFGIAAAVAAPVAGPVEGTTSGATRLTRIGEVVGTPQFMSPEQAAGDEVDGRSDLYALGIVGFYALTGELPFDGPNTQSVLAAQLTRAAPEVASYRPDLPAALTSAVQQCLAKNPADRYQSGEALVEALDAVHAARPEVATAIRLYDQRAQNMFRGMLMISILMPLFVMDRLSVNDEGDAVVLLAFFAAILAGMARSVVGGAQELLRKGFRYEDVRDGVRVIAAEQSDYRASLRGSPADERRRRWRLVLVWLGALLGAALVWWSIATMRMPLPDFGHRMSLPGLVLSGIGVIVFASALITTVTDPRRVKPFERIGVPLWTGSVGRLIFRIARRGVRTATGERPAAAASGTVVATATLTPLALFDSLPKHRRAALDGVRVAITRIESEAAGLGARETELDAALAEARASVLPRGAPAAAAARHAALVDDLAEARRAAGERRAHLLAIAENVRLQLIRVRSGLAERDDVLAELEAAGQGAVPAPPPPPITPRASAAALR